MKVAIEEPGKWERVLTVELPPEDFSGELEKIYREYRDHASFPGFRRGKAPKHLIKARFGKSIEFDLLERVIPRAYRDALESERLTAVSEPEFAKVAFEESAPLSFQARVKVAPRIEPSGYRDMALRLVVAAVSDEAVAQNLESLRERHADYLLVEREAVEGDLVIADYARLEENGKPAGEWTKGFPIAVGEDGLIPEFGRAIRGVKAGEEREATIEHTHSEPHGEGEPPEEHTHVLRYRLVAREVREKKLPTLDDALARKVESGGGDASGPFGSLEELTAEIRRRLALVEEARAWQRMADEATERLVDDHPFEVPEFLVDQLLEGVEVREQDVDPMIIGDRDAKTRKLREEVRPRAERRVRRSLLLSAIAREEQVRVTAEEFEREVARIARREGRSPGEVRDELERADAAGGLRERLLEEKVARFIVENAKVERGSPAA